MINAVLFGALAGSGTLPLARAACERAIRSAGKGAEASLRGFALGYAAAEGKAPAAAQAASTASIEANAPARSTWAPARSTRTPADSLGERVRRTFPIEAQRMIEDGVARVADFQDSDYASLYLDRLEPVAKRDQAHAGAERGKVTGTPVGCACGDGVIDWRRVIDIVRRAPRDIVLSVECGSIDDAAGSIKHLRSLLA